MASLIQQWAPLLETVSFAARAHHGHVRKDRQTPYVAHVFRVCLILRHVFEIDDANVLLTGLLHDTIEDTRTDYDDLLNLLKSRDVPDWIALLSKDTRKVEAEREQEYLEVLCHSPAPVKLCKLADLFDNILDSRHLPDEKATDLLTKAENLFTVLASSRLSTEEAGPYQATFDRCCSLVRDLIQERKQL